MHRNWFDWLLRPKTINKFRIFFEQISIISSSLYPHDFRFSKSSTEIPILFSIPLSTNTHRKGRRRGREERTLFWSWLERWGEEKGGYGRWKRKRTRTTARANGCELTSKAFSRESLESWERGGGDYGQLRYTHSVSPYRSIATGGSHFLANGCFHRSRQRSVFPFNSIISPLPRRFFPFFFRPISLHSLSSHVKFRLW